MRRSALAAGSRQRGAWVVRLRSLRVASLACVARCVADFASNLGASFVAGAHAGRRLRVLRCVPSDLEVLVWRGSSGNPTSRASGRKALSALGAARLEDELTALGRHAGAEAVTAGALQAAGLECTFHCCIPVIYGLVATRCLAGR